MKCFYNEYSISSRSQVVQQAAGSCFQNQGENKDSQWQSAFDSLAPTHPVRGRWCRFVNHLQQCACVTNICSTVANFCCFLFRYKFNTVFIQPAEISFEPSTELIYNSEIVIPGSPNNNIIAVLLEFVKQWCVFFLVSVASLCFERVGIKETFFSNRSLL